MGDRIRKEDRCIYCNCPCTDSGEHNYKKYLKYLVPLLFLCLIMIYPLGDLREFCQNEPEGSNGCITIKGIICNVYRYFRGLKAPELPELPSMLKVPSFPNLIKPCEGPNNDPPKEPLIEPPCIPTVSQHQTDCPPSKQPANKPESSKSKRHPCMFPGCTSGYRCQITRAYF